MAAAAGPRPGGSATARVLAQTSMEVRLTLRNGENLLVTFGLPLVLLVFFSLVDVLPHGAGTPVEFLVPGVLALSIMSTSLVALAIQTGFERFYLVLKRLGATPLRRRELIGAKILTVLAIQAVQVVLVLGIAAGPLGWRPAPSALRWLAPVALVLGTAAFSGLGLAMAGRLRAVGTLALANLLYVTLVLLGGIAFPIDLLPGPVVVLARALPAAPLADLLRAALGQPVSSVPLDLLVLMCWAVGAVVAAGVLFRWE